MFTVTCQYNSTSLIPSWLVTGLATTSDMAVGPCMTTGSFIPQGGVGESTLTVNSQEVIEGTCLRCAIVSTSGTFRSIPGCVTAVGE